MVKILEVFGPHQAHMDLCNVREDVKVNRDLSTS